MIYEFVRRSDMMRVVRVDKKGILQVIFACWTRLWLDQPQQAHSLGVGISRICYFPHWLKSTLDDTVTECPACWCEAMKGWKALEVLSMDSANPLGYGKSPQCGLSSLISFSIGKMSGP